MKQADDTSGLVPALLMIGAMAIIGVIDNFIVRLAEEIGLWQFHATRALLALPMVAALSLLGLGRIRPARLWTVVLRSLLVAVAMLFYFAALAVIPVAQAMAGLFTSPIFIVLITVLAGRQRIGPWRILAVAVGFAGILLVLQPDPRNFEIATLIPVAGGFFYALGAIATYTLCPRESTVSLLMGMMIALGLFGLLGLLGIAVLAPETVPGPDGFVTRGWVWPMWQAAPWVLVQAVGSVVAVFMLTKGYQLGEPSYVGVFEYSLMIFGPLFAWIAFGQAVGPWQVLGIAMIALSGGIIAVRSK